MLSNTKIGLGFIVLGAACAGGAGYAGAPSVADVPVIARDATANGQPALNLQGDYPPEPGVPQELRASAGHHAGTSFSVPSAKPVPPRPAPDMPPALADGTGPRGTSGESQRYDTVGYATWYGEEMQGADTASGQPFDANAITAAHRTLPLGSIIEVTALDTGRTILALVNDRGPGKLDLEVDLSRAAAQSLGVTAVAPVRVRLVTASPPDMMALRAGRSASSRIDAPQALLVALRRKLPVRVAVAPTPKARPERVTRAVAAPPPVRVEPRPVAIEPLAPKPVPRPAIVTAGTFVQVAALSNEGRAKALATTLRGRVQRVGAIFRVQIGPYANSASAKAARDDVARRGYGDARIVQTN